MPWGRHDDPEEPGTGVFWKSGLFGAICCDHWLHFLSPSRALCSLTFLTRL